MTGAGCVQSHPSNDPVHYDCPGPDMRSASVLVFQRLWNHNHPEDRIAEDGSYGPQTGSRVGRSPAGGFADDLCAPPMPVARWGAAFVAQTFPVAAADPIVLRPGEELHGVIELRNSGDQTWDTNTRLATTQPRDRSSLFAGPDWLAPNRAAAVSGSVAPGESFAFGFTLRAPDTLGEHREFFGVVQEGTAWFSDGGQLGPPDDQLQLRILVIDGTEPPVMMGQDAGVTEPETDAAIAEHDAGVTDEPPGTTLVGGCAVGQRGGADLAWLAIALVYFLRRRRATTT
jgi:hypothetical protein